MIRKKDKYQERRFVIMGIFVVTAVVLLVKIFILQVVDTSYRQISANSTVRYMAQFPARGTVYDRKNRLLIYNEASYDLMVIPAQVKNLDTNYLCNLLNITKDDFNNRLAKAKKYSRFHPSVFFGQITKEEYGGISDKSYHFHGFYFVNHAVRHYPYSIAAHTLGNIGEVSSKDIENDAYYKSGDLIGKSGIEYYYEKKLRGKKGVKAVVVDVHNREKESFLNGELDTLPVPGCDLVLGLDAELQQYGERLMNGKMGSIVAIEPSTGQILALVSSPSYDPNALVGRVRGKNYNELLNNEEKPLLNRAASGTYPPGSTFKILNGLIGLQSGVINENSTYVCNGPISHPIKCTHNHHSPTSLTEAVENSCNPYFWNVFRDMLNAKTFGGVKNAFDYWYRQVVGFGFGNGFTTDIAFASSGQIPSRNYYDKIYKGIWNEWTVRSLSIGQGEILVTPVQLANYAAAIGNEGFYYPPHLIRAFGDGSPIDSVFTTKITTDIAPEHFKTMKNGMKRVFEGEHGTARGSAIDSISVAGKTGTAQNPHGEDHSIFIAFAPVDNPQIAIAVIVENAGFGSTYAAPIATLMIEKYIRGYVKRTNVERRIMETELK